ncbi:MAG: hypothetical protein R6V59_02515 [Dehalococcoidia bacterium]
MINLRAVARDLLGLESLANRAYGHDAILKAYAGVRLPYTVPGQIQHGWQRGTGISGDLAKHGKVERACRYFVWNRHNLRRATELGYANALAIGAPFIYLQSDQSPSTPTLGQKSLLLFPFHTWEREPFIDCVRTHREYLAEIRELRSLFSPLTVCLYWVQYAEPEVVRLFEAEGIEVVTCGSRDNNPRFLANFRNITARHTYVCSNHFSTAVFYALYMRKKVFLFGKSRSSEVHWFSRNQPAAAGDDPVLYPQLLWPNFDDKSHYWIGEEELGFEFKRSPAQLRELFGWYPANFVRQSVRRPLVASRRLARAGLRRMRGSVTTPNHPVNS